MTKTETDTPTQITYSVHCQGYDWGPANHKIVIDFGQVIDEQVDASFFEVLGEKEGFDWSTKMPKQIKGKIELKEAYLSDSTGQKQPVDLPTTCVTLALQVHPDAPLTSPFVFNPQLFLNQKRQTMYTITLKKPLCINGSSLNELVLTNQQFEETVYEGTEQFLQKEFFYEDAEFGEITLHHALFEPKEKGKHPLIILLHGAGEGGTDPEIALLGNKVVAWADPEVQAMFGGAYVLVPQVPDMWMNDGSGGYTQDGTSKYTRAVSRLIDEAVQTFETIDPTRIYLGGGSNGGFMTINLLLRKPNFFAAAFPICQAYKTQWLDQRQLEGLKEVPLWLTHGIHDQVVSFNEHSQSLYETLKAMNHPNLHVTALEAITDETGCYQDGTGAPYRYNDHWAWIPVYNGEIANETQSLFHWLAKQKR